MPVYLRYNTIERGHEEILGNFAVSAAKLLHIHVRLLNNANEKGFP